MSRVALSFLKRSWSRKGYQIALAILLTGGLAIGTAQAAQNASFSDGAMISPDRLVQEMSGKKPPIVVDVREPDEFQGGHIKGALSIPLSVLQTRFQEIPKNRAVVVYCRSGHRSAQAQAFLEAQGYKNIESMTGGLNNWHAALQKDRCSSSHC